MYRQLKNAPRRFIDKIAFSKKFNIEDTLMISGSPRSGTTWLMQILGNIPDYLTLFEPLQHEHFPRSNKAGFDSRSYIPPLKKCTKKREYLDDIFRGKIISLMPRYKFNKKIILRRVNADKLLVKFVRANRLIPWITKNFELKKIIYIIRHPCATIASQLRTGYMGNNYDRLYFYRKSVYNAKKFNFIFNDINKLIKNHRNYDGILAINWALDQLIPISVIKKNDEKVLEISYENLLFYGIKELDKILSTLNINAFNKDIIKQLEAPSFTSNKNNLYKKYQINKWKNYLTENNLKNIKKVLEYFNFYFDDINYRYNDKNFVNI